MAKRITKSHMAHIDAAAAHLHAIGAKHPGMPDTTPLGSKADMSLSDQMQAVAQSVYMAGTNSDGYCCIEEVFDDYAIIEVSGGMYFRADYSMATDGAVTLAARDSWVEVEEVWQPVSASAKAGLTLQEQSADVSAVMKAAGHRELDVIIAFGSKRSKDTHEEYFSANTDLAEADFPTPPLIYYHGYDQKTNKAMSKPVVIGKPIRRWNTDAGHVIRYALKNNTYADQTWDEACKAPVPASPGTVGYLIRKAPDGELLYWPIAEVSAWDRSGGRKQAYRHTVATAALKALYIAEGISLPSPITANGAPPEIPGDGMSAGDPMADLTLDQAGPAIAHVIAQGLLALRNKRNT